ncbi:MAG: cytochrome c-type biogenesis protein CcmH [Gemmatimonadota bacterium]|nr:cytochrome c-type biogenesis protein CcmH [Gemmatimonadota bacterium]
MAARRALASLCLFAALLVLLTGSADAQAPTPTPASGAAARAAIGQIRSPYCPGLMLEVCPSPQAQALRDSIHVRAAGGENAGSLVEWVIGRHGEEWRAVPKRSGWGWWAWVLPPLVLLLGAGVVLARVRSGRGSAEAPGAAAPISEAERAELAAAMHDMDGDGR